MYSKLITSVATLALILPTLAGTADARGSFGGGHSGFSRGSFSGGHSSFSSRSFAPTTRTARPQRQAIARPNASIATTRPMRTRNTVQITSTNPAGPGALKSQTGLAMHTRSGTFGVNNGAGAIFGGTPANPAAAPANPAGGPIKLGANAVPATSTMNPTFGNAAVNSYMNANPPHGVGIGTAFNPSGQRIVMGGGSTPRPPINNGPVIMGGGSTANATPTGGGTIPSGGGGTFPSGGGGTFPSGGGGTFPSGGGGAIPVDPGMGGGDRIVIPGQRRLPPAVGGQVATLAMPPLPAPVVVPSRAMTVQPQACLVKDYLKGAVMFKDVCTNEWALNASDGVLKASAGTCLTKQYPQADTVLFKDVCTNEWAMNAPPVR